MYQRRQRGLILAMIGAVRAEGGNAFPRHDAANVLRVSLAEGGHTGRIILFMASKCCELTAHMAPLQLFSPMILGGRLRYATVPGCVHLTSASPNSDLQIDRPANTDGEHSQIRHFPPCLGKVFSDFISSVHPKDQPAIIPNHLFHDNAFPGVLASGARNVHPVGPAGKVEYADFDALPCGVGLGVDHDVGGKDVGNVAGVRGLVKGAIPLLHGVLVIAGKGGDDGSAVSLVGKSLTLGYLRSRVGLQEASQWCV